MAKWYQVKNLGDAVGEIRLRGIIGYSNKDEEGWFGTYEGQAGTVKEFEKELTDLGAITTLNLYISSEGGLVSDGLAIHAILKRHPANVVAFIDGYAFSIATVVAMAADEIRMPSNALMMIHNASTWTAGDYRDMEREAEGLKVHNQAIRRAYATKSGRDEKEFIGLMDATTYMDGPTAKSLGLCDVVTDEVALANIALHPRVKNSAEFKKLPPSHTRFFDIVQPPKLEASNPSDESMKLIFALLPLFGITAKGDETEAQLETLIKNHKPSAPKLEMNLEDPETKKLFDKAVSDGITAALPGAVENATAALKADLAKVNALLTNGAAGAAGAGAPVPTPTPENKSGKTMARAEWNALDAHARAEFLRTAGNKLTD